MMTNDKLTLKVKKVRLNDDDLKAIVKRVQSSRSIQWWKDDIKQLLYEVKCLKDEAAEVERLRAACSTALDWIDRFSIHSPVAFGGEAELASQLNEALERRALEPPGS